MKGWKKCMVFLLALGICIGLAACGEDSSEGESEDYYIPGVVEDTDNFTDEHLAEQLGYDSIEDMRTQVNITVQMYPCSEGTDTDSPAL